MEPFSVAVASPDETRRDSRETGRPSLGTPSSQYVVSPLKARAGWILLVAGLYLMIIGGNTHFCEGFANRVIGKPNEVDKTPVIPMWPPTISSMSANIMTPAGRFFFVFMLLGGAFVVQSNALPLSFAEDVPGTAGITYIVSMAMCLGTILVGACPTDIMQRSSSNAPHTQKDRVSGYVHIAGAGCAFILLPIAELYIIVKRKGQPTENPNLRILQKIATALGLSFFLAFQLFNSWAKSTYRYEYISDGSCGGQEGNDCREYHLGWINLVGFWLEYSCANCAIALLGIRIFSCTPEGVMRLANARHWDVRLDDPMDNTIPHPGPIAAMIFQLVMDLLSIAIMLWNWQRQGTLCCACALGGDSCFAIYQNVNNGTQVCTSDILN